MHSLCLRVLSGEKENTHINLTKALKSLTLFFRAKKVFKNALNALLFATAFSLADGDHFVDRCALTNGAHRLTRFNLF